jgi:RNA polymerase sigma-70 factor (ECF subfamily)
LFTLYFDAQNGFPGNHNSRFSRPITDVKYAPKERRMPPSAEDTILSLPLLGAAESALTGHPSTPENEVIALFNQLRNPLLRYTMSLGVNTFDGEDLIQETFLSLFRHLRLGKSRANLRGWVFRVAHNLALKHRNSPRNRNTVAVTEHALAERQIDPETNPEERFADDQRQQILLSVIQALPEQDQNCLRLRAEGLRYREIAQALDMSLGAVANSLVRSFERLNRADGR